MDKFTLTVTKKHLDKAIKEYKNSFAYVSLSRCCAIIHSFKEKFPDETDILMGIDRFVIAHKIFKCDKAREITEWPTTEANRKKLENLLPMELEFVRI